MSTSVDFTIAKVRHVKGMGEDGSAAGSESPGRGCSLESSGIEEAPVEGQGMDVNVKGSNHSHNRSSQDSGVDVALQFSGDSSGGEQPLQVSDVGLKFSEDFLKAAQKEVQTRH